MPEDRREYKRVGENTFSICKKNKNGDIGTGNFLKTECSGIPQYEVPNIQRKSYKILENYLHMPKCALLKKDTGDLLVVNRVNGTTFNKAMLTNNYSFEIAALDFIHDLSNMWNQTTRKMEEDKLEIDLRNDSVETIKTVLRSDKIKMFKDFPIIVNNIIYPSFENICRNVLNELQSKKDPLMVLGHGDEHFKNLHISKANDKDTYSIIDPRKAGYYSPAYSINTFIGSTLAFDFDYKGDFKIENNKAIINFEMKNDFKQIMPELTGFLGVFKAKLANLSPISFLEDEYIFANLIRSSIGRVASKNKAVAEKNGMFTLGLAIEMYNKYGKN